MKGFFLVTCLAFGLPLSSLFASGLDTEADDSRGVKLSDAMDSAAKGDKRDLGGEDSSSSSDSDCDDDESDGSGWVALLGQFHGASYKKTEYFWQLPFEVRYSVPFSGDIRGLTHFTLTPFSVEDEKIFLGLYIGGAIVDLQPGSLPERATEDLWMFETGLTFRWYLNRSHTALSPYLAGSIGFQSLGWDYRNPIVAGGDTIEDDNLGGINGYAGLGVSTKRDSHISFFAEVGVGGTGFGKTTREGFDNDVFDAFGSLAVKAGLTFRF